MSDEVVIPKTEVQSIGVHLSGKLFSTKKLYFKIINFLQILHFGVNFFVCFIFLNSHYIYFIILIILFLSTDTFVN